MNLTLERIHTHLNLSNRANLFRLTPCQDSGAQATPRRPKGLTEEASEAVTENSAITIAHEATLRPVSSTRKTLETLAEFHTKSK